MADLSRAGKRLMGFCRTNLFKRLESSGQAFIQSVERHVLRNYIYLHAIEKDLPIPIGTQDAELLDSRFADDDEASLWESEEAMRASGPPEDLLPELQHFDTLVADVSQDIHELLFQFTEIEQKAPVIYAGDECESF